MSSTNSIPVGDLESSSAASFNNIGDKYIGVITAISHQQQTDPKTGQPKFFSSGQPMMLFVITLQPEGDADPVALWAKGGRFTPATGSGESMMSAIGTAARQAGAESVDVGGLLAVAFTGETKAEPGMNPAKLYTAQYRPPAPQAASVPTDLFSQ